ncbi:MAG: sirohydrochlorin cobaltochelatase [Anaerovoracaceae bacterium]|jgi:cobalamin biosynthesis Co2+ chelatase CbiK
MIKEKDKAILVVSFGTSYKETRDKTIGAIEADIQYSWPAYEVRRAFTSGMILRVLEKRDGIKIDTVEEALNGLADDGFSKIYIQPTHVINGDEYEKMLRDIDRVESRFETVKVGTPLLTETSDYQIVAKEILSQLPKLDKKEALVLMGHGTEHHVNAVYPAMDYHFKAMGHPNVFVGTVEGYPDLETVLNQVNQYKPEKIVLLPFMVVAGDHACNDMAGDEEDSWKSVFEAEGYQVDTILKGLGEFEGIRDLYLKHLKAIMD